MFHISAAAIFLFQIPPCLIFSLTILANKRSNMFRTESPLFSPPSKFPPAGKRSPASSKTLTLLSRSFDETLLRRLKTLDPPSISLSWLSRAVDFLSSTHADAETLISDLKLSAPEEPLASYLDESVKVLDVCNSISAEIEKLRHGRLLIHFFLHLLKVSDGDRKIPAPENLNRASVSLADYKKCSATERKQSLETPAVLIREQIRGLGNPPRGKISTVEKLLQRTIYAVGAVTVFVTGAVVTILDGSTETADADVGGDFLWAEEFNRLRSAFADSISKRFSGEKKRFAEEVEALEAGVKEIGDIITDVSETDAERFYIAVNGLERLTEAYALGLDRLLNGVNGFFRGVLSARNSLLHNYRQ